ncbi:MAG: hypothetical protein JKY93_03290 [Gammaproteobacteria bacterium]|nr:hypothetical protein [Gammaproteobacteria bacterium]
MRSAAFHKFLRTIGKVSDEKIRRDLFEIEVIEAGGTISDPLWMGKTPCIEMPEIHLHEIYVTGNTLAQAMDRWQRIAENLVEQHARAQSARRLSCPRQQADTCSDRAQVSG